MAIELLAYEYVSVNAQVARAQLRPHEENTEEFIHEHYKELVKRGEEGDSPAAVFCEEEARTLFGQLDRGSPEEFLDAVTIFTERLVAEMNGRTSPGLLLFARLNVEEKALTVVLKLQVTSKNAGVLQELADGTQSLGTVRNVLDAPGKIQKGLVTPDGREDSDVIVGDKLAQKSTAEYFVRAFGIRIDARPEEAALAFLRAVNSVDPKLTSRVVSALEGVEGGALPAVTEGLLEQVPELEQNWDAIESKLQEHKRPIRNVGTSTAFRATITAGLITISGPASAIDQSTAVTENDKRGWTVTVVSSTEPKKTYK
ncbi:hypothetical protein [Amycolatopsis sp. WGS_07]|uniref:hypothetical protein n=1 Tax=Amycolatopsis sp. WGS_07 TaxID=3076764 RepID=UPI003873440F